MAPQLALLRHMAPQLALLRAGELLDPPAQRPASVRGEGVEGTGVDETVEDGPAHLGATHEVLQGGERPLCPGTQNRVDLGGTDAGDILQADTNPPLRGRELAPWNEHVFEFSPILSGGL